MVKHVINKKLEMSKLIARLGFSWKQINQPQAPPLWSHHGSDLIKGLQVLHDSRLMCGLHSGKAPGGTASMALLLWAEVIKFAACVGLAQYIFCVPKDAKSAADGHSCAFVVPCDHDHPNACPGAASDTCSHLWSWWV